MRTPARPPSAELVRTHPDHDTAAEHLRRDALGPAGRSSVATPLEARTLVLTTPTGRIGSQVLERLLATQEEIRVIVRDPSRLDPRTTGRVEVVRGTHDDPAAATALLLDRTWTGRAGVPGAGPDDLTPQEMARVMSTSLQREVGFEQLDVGELGSALVRYGMAQGAARGVAEMVAAQNDGIYDDEPRGTPSLAPTTSFAQWCDDVLAPAVSVPTP